MKPKTTGLAAVLWITLFCSSAVFAEPVWIDVRSAEEHSADNIEGDIRISHSDILEEVRERFPDRDTEIQLYCRSGRRAEAAMSALLEAGYTSVSNVGGIGEARTQRGLLD